MRIDYKLFFTIFLVCSFLLASRGISKSILKSNVVYLNEFKPIDRDIILYGDSDHFSRLNHNNFAKLIKDGYERGSEKTCIFLEFDNRLQSYFDEYSSRSDMSLDDLFKKAEYQFPNDRVISANSEISLYFSEIFKVAKSSNFKIVAADIDFSTTDGFEILKALDFHLNNPTNIQGRIKFAKQLIESRNKSLAKKISMYFKNDICSKIIVYFGDGHFQSRYQEVEIKSVQDFLVSSE